MTTGQAIRKARKRANITQAQLAARINCTEGYVAHLERGRSLPSENKLLRICDVLRMDKREMIRQRQKEKATGEARPFYDDPPQAAVYFREGHSLTSEQMQYAMKVIQAIERDEKVRAAIDLIIGEEYHGAGKS